MGNPWASTFDITKACPTTQTSCTASTRGPRELCLTRTSSCTWTSTLTAGQPRFLFCSTIDSGKLDVSCSGLILVLWAFMRGNELHRSCILWKFSIFPLGLTLDCSTWGYTFHRAIQNDRDSRWFSAPGNAETDWSGVWALASSPLTECFLFLWFVSMSLASFCSWMVQLVPYNCTWGSVVICPVNIYTGCDLLHSVDWHCLTA